MINLDGELEAFGLIKAFQHWPGSARKIQSFAPAMSRTILNMISTMLNDSKRATDALYGYLHVGYA